MEIFSMQLEALSVFSYLNYLTKELLIHGNIFCFILFHNKVTRSNKSLEIWAGTFRTETGRGDGSRRMMSYVLLKGE